MYKVTVSTGSKGKILKMILFLFSLFIAVSFLGCGNGEDPKEEKEDTKDEKGINDVKEEKEEEKAIACHYCGMFEDEAEEYEIYERPFIITLGNTSSERPQAGVNDACIIYELMVEGDKTRLLALFNKEVPGDIGNIRSARLDFIPLVLENDAYYVHIGGHQPALNKIHDIGVASIDEFRNAIPFTRVEHKSPPDDAYVELDALKETADSIGYRDEGEREEFMEFDRDNEFSGEEAKEVQITYGTYNIVNYEYQEDDKVYLRSVNGDYHRDESNEEKIEATNILIQYADTRVMDDVGRKDIDVVGSGEGKYISKGKVKPITWEKVDKESPTRFYNEEGEEITLTPGQTWINLVPGRDDVEVE